MEFTILQREKKIESNKMKIAIFGTVGAGKTSLSQGLSKKLGYNIFPEPVDQNPYFENFYKNPKEFVFRMQVYMLTARSRQLFAAKGLQNTIFDRAIIEDPIFMLTSYKMGIIDDLDYQTYDDFYNEVILKNLTLTKDRLNFDLVVYLRVSLEKSIERIHKRGRKPELEIDEHYWKVLNDSYEEYYEKNKNNFNFLVIDGNQEGSDEIVKQVVQEINKIKGE